MSCIYVIDTPSGGYIGLDSDQSSHIKRLSHHLAGSFHITKWNGNSSIKYYGSEKLLGQNKIGDCNFWVNYNSNNSCYGIGADVWEAFTNAGWTCDNLIKGRLDFAETAFIIANANNILGSGTRFTTGNRDISDSQGSDFYYDAKQDEAVKNLLSKLNSGLNTKLDVIQNVGKQSWRIGIIRMHIPDKIENIIKLSNPAEYAFYEIVFTYIRDYIMTNEILYYDFLRLAIAKKGIVKGNGKGGYKIEDKAAKGLIRAVYGPHIKKIIDIAKDVLKQSRKSTLKIKEANLDTLMDQIILTIVKKGIPAIVEYINLKAIKTYLSSEDFSNALIATIYGIKKASKHKNEAVQIRAQITQQINRWSGDTNLSHIDIRGDIKRGFQLDMSKTAETNFTKFSRIVRESFNSLGTNLYDTDPNNIPYWLKLVKERCTIHSVEDLSRKGFHNVNHSMKEVYIDIMESFVKETSFTMDTWEQPATWLSTLLQLKFNENREYSFSQDEWYEFYHRAMSIIAGRGHQYRVMIKEDDIVDKVLPDGTIKENVRERRGSFFSYSVHGQEFTRQKYRIVPRDFDVNWNYNWSQSLFEQYETWENKAPKDIPWKYFI